MTTPEETRFALAARGCTAAFFFLVATPVVLLLLGCASPVPEFPSPEVVGGSGGDAKSSAGGFDFNPAVAAAAASRAVSVMTKNEDDVSSAQAGDAPQLNLSSSSKELFELLTDTANDPVAQSFERQLDLLFAQLEALTTAASPPTAIATVNASISSIRTEMADYLAAKLATAGEISGFSKLEWINWVSVIIKVNGSDVEKLTPEQISAVADHLGFALEPAVNATK